MTSRLACIAVVVVTTTLLGCAGERSPTEGGMAESTAMPRLGGEVVATVGARPILRAEVQAVAERDGLTARQALDALETRLLLEAEARRRGLDRSDSRHGELRERQALAQLVLRRIEHEHPRGAITEADIAARTPSVLTAMTRPEMRSVTHLLVRAESGASADERRRVTAVASRALELARAEPSDAQTLERVATALRAIYPGADVVVETLPAFDAGAGYDAPFIAVAFATPPAGLARSLAETSYGAHVVYVTSIEPAVVPEAAAVRQRVIRDVLNTRRRLAFAALMRDLMTRTPPETDRALVERTLGDDHLFEAIR